MNKLLWVSTIILLVGLVFGGCQQSVPSATEATGAPAAKATASITKAAWEQQWDNTVAEARKEGQLSFYGSVGGPFRELGMDKHLSQKFGLTMDITAGGASELIPKVAAERRAGINRGDIFVLSTNTLINTLKPGGLTESLDQIVFLPEVVDPNAWYQGHLPWVDKDHRQLAMLAGPIQNITINTDLVKPEEIKSYRDLLNPKWKGRIGLIDPTQGAALIWFGAMVEGTMDLNYLREFAKQEPITSKNDYLMCEGLSRGKYAIMVGIGSKIVAQFKGAGSPIESIVTVEGTHVATESAGLALLKNPEHPNAAKLFVNWILTKEGVTFVSRAYGSQSARVDVPTDFLDPKHLRQPGTNYLNCNTEEYSLRQPEYIKLAAEVFASSLK